MMNKRLKVWWYYKYATGRWFELIFYIRKCLCQQRYKWNNLNQVENCSDVWCYKWYLCLSWKNIVPSRTDRKKTVQVNEHTVSYLSMLVWVQVINVTRDLIKKILLTTWWLEVYRRIKTKFQSRWLILKNKRWVKVCVLFRKNETNSVGNKWIGFRTKLILDSCFWREHS